MPWRLADAACSHRATPSIAFIVAGNLRSFTDARAHQSLRHHLIDGLGGNANSSVFIYGKRDTEQWRPHNQPAHNERDVRSGTDDEELKAAEQYISAHGGPHVFSQYVQSSKQAEIININCLHFQKSLKDSSHPEFKYALSALGQVHAVAMAFRMMLRHEQQHSFRFDLVARVRPDGMWWHTAPAHCFLKPGFAYTMDDHFWITPRAGAERVFDAFDDYRKCGNELSANHMTQGVAIECCGGGATGIFLGALKRWFPLRLAGETVFTALPKLLNGARDGTGKGPLGLWSFQVLKVAHEAIQETENATRTHLADASSPHCGPRYVNGHDGGMAVYPDLPTCNAVLRPAFGTNGVGVHEDVALNHGAIN